VSQLIRAQGEERARLWLEEDSGNGVPRLELLATGRAGVMAVLRAAAPLIFPVAEARPMTDADETDLEWGTDVADTAILSAGSGSRAAFSEPPRRVRKV
jgi:hypothetical protein